MMKPKKANSNMTKSLMVFLLLIFVMLGLYIAVWISNVYKGTTAYTETNGKTAIECIGYSVYVSDLKYSNNQVSFLIENAVHSDLDINGLEIKSGAQKVLDNTTIKIGRKARINAKLPNLLQNATFFIYPKGCNSYPQICNVDGCKRLEDYEQSNTTDFF